VEAFYIYVDIIVEYMEYFIMKTTLMEDLRMNEILKKLKLTKQNPVLILNAPEEYKDIMKDIEAEVHTEISGKYEFIQLFARNIQEAVDHIEGAVSALEGDGHLWVCYPKGTSKKYKSDLGRDNLNQITSPYDFEGVTLVAINEDWSAFRIRHVDNIKSSRKK
jgi:hypothetical protein